MNTKTDTIGKHICSHYNSLSAFALRLTGNNDNAHDLLQDTIVRIIEKNELYRNDVSFASWARTIMYNIFVNSHNRNKILQKYKETAVDGEDGNPAYYEGIVSEHEILTVIRSLPRECAGPLLLYIQGHKYTEIARQMNINLSTVKNRIHKARTQLATLLKDYII